MEIHKDIMLREMHIDDVPFLDLSPLIPMFCHLGGNYFKVVTVVLCCYQTLYEILAQGIVILFSID